MIPTDPGLYCFFFHNYTPGIYAEAVYSFWFHLSVRSFVCSFVRMFVSTSVALVEFMLKFLVKVSLEVYISATSGQKAFIFEP